MSSMARVDPDHWEIPNWHPDWDGDFTFAGLRAFAKALHDATDLDAKLAIIEDGYAHLDVFKGAMRIGIVYVNRGDGGCAPQFSVYAGAEDQELTTADVGAGLRFLDDQQTLFPEDA